MARHMAGHCARTTQSAICDLGPTPQRPTTQRPTTSDSRPEDLRPEGGKSPGGKKPRGGSPRGRKPRGRTPRSKRPRGRFLRIGWQKKVFQYNKCTDHPGRELRIKVHKNSMFPSLHPQILENVGLMAIEKVLVRKLSTRSACGCVDPFGFRWD